MDFEGKKFGSGLKELCGSVDLVNQFKLWPHHEFFCKRSLPLTVSETHYLQNVVGDTEIRKGEGMLDQHFHNAPYLEGKAGIHIFNLGVLTEAFQMREATRVDLSSVDKGIPTVARRFRNESKKDEGMKHRKHKMHKDKNKDKDHKKHKHRNEDGSNEKHRKRCRIRLGPNY